ncbi:hypothetical protein AMJ49_02985 [Parcubacteria bacterium DG_74_2]|nr:MAG: hypothetical protein AMJ49_02985 [Parcubacteria bacterium DG_74_2]
MITKKRKIQKGQDVVFSILIITLFLLLVAFFVFSNWKISKKRQNLTKEIESLKQEITILEEKNESLKAGISQSEKEDFWEEKVREQGYQKPGEKQVVILPPEEKVEEEKETMFFQNLLEWIKSKLR